LNIDWAAWVAAAGATIIPLVSHGLRRRRERAETMPNIRATYLIGTNCFFVHLEIHNHSSEDITIDKVIASNMAFGTYSPWDGERVLPKGSFSPGWTVPASSTVKHTVMLGDDGGNSPNIRLIVSSRARTLKSVPIEIIPTTKA
jgi:hypothetical protein